MPTQKFWEVYQLASCFFFLQQSSVAISKWSALRLRFFACRSDVSLLVDQILASSCLENPVVSMEENILVDSIYSLYQGLNDNRYWFLNFKEGSLILDSYFKCVYRSCHLWNHVNIISCQVNLEIIVAPEPIAPLISSRCRSAALTFIQGSIFWSKNNIYPPPLF
jgi:hypothetical protein